MDTIQSCVNCQLIRTNILSVVRYTELRRAIVSTVFWQRRSFTLYHRTTGAYFDYVPVEALALICGKSHEGQWTVWAGALALSVTPGGGVNKWRQRSASRAVPLTVSQWVHFMTCSLKNGLINTPANIAISDIPLKLDYWAIFHLQNVSVYLQPLLHNSYRGRRKKRKLHGHYAV